MYVACGLHFFDLSIYSPSDLEMEYLHVPKDWISVNFVEHTKEINTWITYESTYGYASE